MSINKLIEEYKNNKECFEFKLKKNESINTIIKQKNIPNKYGVYIIYSIKDKQENIIYIGKSGTLNNDGTFKSQGLANRLKAKQNGKSRNSFFKEVILDKSFDELKFLCIITYNENMKNIELPILSESKLIQEYFSEHKKLPLLNKSV